MQASGLPSGGRRLCFVFGEVFLCGMLAAADRLGTLDRGGLSVPFCIFRLEWLPSAAGGLRRNRTKAKARAKKNEPGNNRRKCKLNKAERPPRAVLQRRPFGGKV